MKVLVTGTAGFIGFHLTRRLLERGDEVVAIDNLNNYYDVGLKIGRLAELGIQIDGGPGALTEGGESVSAGTGLGGAASQGGGSGSLSGPATGDASKRRATWHSDRYPALTFHRLDLTDAAQIRELFVREQFGAVCNLAAQAGVRYSLDRPDTYARSNIAGFLNILEAARATPVSHVVYASSSSVYGIERTIPFSESASCDHPASLYAASKRANELTAHTYSHLFGIPTTGLRFFTVYGPWGRPDMAPFLFTRAISEGRPIRVFNYGKMKRDFTYIDDIVEGVVRVIDSPPEPDAAWDGSASERSSAPYRLYNIGNGKPVDLMEFVATIERAVGREAQKEMEPMQPGDVETTWADCSALEAAVGYRPATPLTEGIERFVEWYRGYYR